MFEGVVSLCYQRHTKLGVVCDVDNGVPQLPQVPENVLREPEPCFKGSCFLASEEHISH